MFVEVAYDVPVCAPDDAPPSREMELVEASEIGGRVGIIIGVVVVAAGGGGGGDCTLVAGL